MNWLVLEAMVIREELQPSRRSVGIQADLSDSIQTPKHQNTSIGTQTPACGLPSEGADPSESLSSLEGSPEVFSDVIRLRGGRQPQLETSLAQRTIYGDLLMSVNAAKIALRRTNKSDFAISENRTLKLSERLKRG